MTPAQIKLARSALGLKPGTRRSYRNRFSTSPLSDNYDDWTAMVKAGLAEIDEPDSGPRRFAYFSLTRAGAEAVLQPGETLCPEDFPT